MTTSREPRAAESDDFGTRTFEATPYQWRPPESLPTRSWIYGCHYIGGYVTATIAPPGVGKSSLSMVEALCVAADRALLGVAPDLTEVVWIWNGEDPYDELQRRLAAAIKFYGLQRDELEQRLFLDSGRAKPMKICTQHGSKTLVNWPLVSEIIREIRRNRVGLLIIDPFVSCHSVPENDNSGINQVIGVLAHIADRTGCAIEVVHHSRKAGGAELTAEDSRGASALIGAVRSARVLNSIRPSERTNVDAENPKSIFRIDIGKSNMAASSTSPAWYQLVSVHLDNAFFSGLGDSVGVVTCCSPPISCLAPPADMIRAVQEAIGINKHRESHQAHDWVGKVIASVLNHDLADKAGRAKTVSFLKHAIQSGALVRVEELDAHRERRTFIRSGLTI